MHKLKPFLIAIAAIFFVSNVFAQVAVDIPIQPQRGVVKAVHDGDSFRVQWLNDSLNRNEWLRLYRADTPEVPGPGQPKYQQGGKEAGDFVRGLIKNDTIVFIPLNRDQYGRQVADVWITLLVDSVKTQVSLTKLLIEDGWAWPVFAPGTPLKDQDELKALQKQAQYMNRGIWDKKRFPKRNILPSTFRKNNPRKQA